MCNDFCFLSIYSFTKKFIIVFYDLNHNCYFTVLYFVLLFHAQHTHTHTYTHTIRNDNNEINISQKLLLQAIK